MEVSIAFEIRLGLIAGPERAREITIGFGSDKRPLTFGHHSGLAHPRQDAVQFANFHSCDDSLDRRDELVLLANCDCSFTPLKLDGLCAIVDGENDSSRRISAPPCTDTLPDQGSLSPLELFS